ncbi:MAG: bifunctional phosphoserine phosphatase/homoserine phosphotransferase ThrH [Chloroflexi bacterium]|nr:bifunctional phosphoserine phosphatase/homoserine phosphotransferase ThrH [Chloroflexota bacterium]
MTTNPLPTIVTLDLEGVFTPEIWHAVAEETNIPALRLTTRDEPDYDKLMKYRINILQDNNLSLRNIQDVIASMALLPGARAFLDWLRCQTQAIILSDTFYEFAAPFMQKLGEPTLFCNMLQVNDRDMIVDYHLRIDDGKREAVMALKRINFRVIAAGDSYNDTTMLAAADHGILFRPPQNVIDDFPQFPVTSEYDELKELFTELLNG